MAYYCSVLFSVWERSPTVHLYYPVEIATLRTEYQYSNTIYQFHSFIQPPPDFHGHLSHGDPSDNYLRNWGLTLPAVNYSLLQAIIDQPADNVFLDDRVAPAIMYTNFAHMFDDIHSVTQASPTYSTRTPLNSQETYTTVTDIMGRHAPCIHDHADNPDLFSCSLRRAWTLLLQDNQNLNIPDLYVTLDPDSHNRSLLDTRDRIQRSFGLTRFDPPLPRRDDNDSQPPDDDSFWDDPIP